MNNFKKDLACNITLITVLTLTVLYLITLTLNLFGVFNIVFYESFNYILAYILVILCLMLYILGFFISRVNRLNIPKWFRILFYVAFFLFTNVYYMLNWFSSMIGLIFFFSYLAFLINVIALSIFYNVQKDEKNRLKSTKRFLLTSVFFYSIAVCAFVQYLVNLTKIVIFPTYVFNTLTAFVIEMSVMLVVTIIMTMLYAMSLNKRKYIINACLIKVDRKQKTM